ncbi:hypothetical protein yaldo0001_12070 [Yersinia aldovae ATCC 35236]|nr:hypothetical protein yaldo0001_12070 [Yersinia aldovae ATCC 35236]
MLPILSGSFILIREVIVSILTILAMLQLCATVLNKSCE